MRLQEQQPAQKNEAKKTFLPCSYFGSARETFSQTLGDRKFQGPPGAAEILLDFFQRISLNLNAGQPP